MTRWKIFLKTFFPPLFSRRIFVCCCSSLASISQTGHLMFATSFLFGFAASNTETVQQHFRVVAWKIYQEQREEQVGQMQWSSCLPGADSLQIMQQILRCKACKLRGFLRLHEKFFSVFQLLRSFATSKFRVLLSKGLAQRKWRYWLVFQEKKILKMLKCFFHLRLTFKSLFASPQFIPVLGNMCKVLAKSVRCRQIVCGWDHFP